MIACLMYQLAQTGFKAIFVQLIRYKRTLTKASKRECEKTFFLVCWRHWAKENPAVFYFTSLY